MPVSRRDKIARRSRRNQRARYREILGMLDRDGALHLDDVGDTGCGPSQDLESLRFRSTSRH